MYLGEVPMEARPQARNRALPTQSPQTRRHTDQHRIRHDNPRPPRPQPLPASLPCHTQFLLLLQQNPRRKLLPFRVRTSLIALKSRSSPWPNQQCLNRLCHLFPKLPLTRAPCHASCSQDQHSKANTHTCTSSSCCHKGTCTSPCFCALLLLHPSTSRRTICLLGLLPRTRTTSTRLPDERCES